MDEDNNHNNSDRLLSETPDLSNQPQQQQQPAQLHESSGSMSLGAAPNGDGGVSPINGDSNPSTTHPPAQIDSNAKAVYDVVNSEVRATLSVARRS